MLTKIDLLAKVTMEKLQNVRKMPEHKDGGVIDSHCHLGTEEYVRALGIVGDLFKDMPRKTVADMIQEYDEAGVQKVVIVGWDAETTTGLKVPNDYIADVVNKHPDRFIGFASVDPHKGRIAVKELERSVEDLKLRGLKLHPIVQEFFPNDRRFYPLYEKCVELKIPVMFHSGIELAGAGLPGGAGIKQKYARPIWFDDVAADFPELRIDIAHPGWPWEDEQIAIVMHKGNVYMDLAGVPPRYYSPTLRTYLKAQLFNSKVMFGTDYPYLHPAEVIKEFKELNLKPEVQERILNENAKRFLEL
jgi:hypothetical protein